MATCHVRRRIENRVIITSSNQARAMIDSRCGETCLEATLAEGVEGRDFIQSNKEVVATTRKVRVMVAIVVAARRTQAAVPVPSGFAYPGRHA